MSISDFAELLVARKWLAGPNISDAIRLSRKFNEKRVRALINYLGEEYHKKENVEDAVEKYIALIEEIKESKIKADITLKPTQIGLLLGKKIFESNYRELVSLAKKNNIFVWLDMEEAWSVSQTITAFLLMQRSGNTGICIQSYLKRSIDDIKILSKRNAIIRLVKGAHKVPEHGGYPNREEATKNYYVLMDYMFKHCREFTIGSHDMDILEKALALNKKYKRKVTYAMLTGIRNDYAFELAKRGEKVAIYVTFGKHWVSYSYRRLKEMSNLKLIVRSLFGG